MISEETRAESFRDLEIEEKQKQVLACLGNEEMTVREVLKEMLRRGYTKMNDRNEVAPRMTELFQKRQLVIVAKRIDEETGKSTAVYRKAILQEDNMAHIPRLD